MKKKLLCWGLLLATLAVCPACSDDDDKVSEPTFSEITVTPAQATYHVGDVITCTVSRKTAGSPEPADGSSYWFYASWWFSDPNLKADFQEAQADGTFTSSDITLTEPGTVTLYFFGQLRYPKWDYRKVEISKTINVIE